MVKKHKYITIKCTERQAVIIEVALDTLSRMVCGQLHTMIDGMDSIRGKILKVKIPCKVGTEDATGYKLGDYIEKLIKPILFPELYPNESYGVGCKEIGDAQVAYEMIKILSNHRSKSHEKGCHCVMHHSPLHYSKEPLIEISEGIK